jgi:FSR family fosmidomycin resistance protein-like MFS transporter
LSTTGIKVEPQRQVAEGTVFSILAAISFSHLLNDMIQSLLPAIYPILKSNFHLDFAKIGLITLTTQLTASLLQPLIGLYTDRKPKPYSLPFGMGFTLVGLALLSMASSYAFILVAAGLIGMGSAVFHPESSRVARRASGGRRLALCSPRLLSCPEGSTVSCGSRWPRFSPSFC